MIDVNNITLTLVRHSESVENATKYSGFYSDPRAEGSAEAHQRSKNVGITSRGLLEAAWLGKLLDDTVNPIIYTSTYDRAKKTGTVAFPDTQLLETPLLDEQHYGDVTYMTKAELYRLYPESKDDRQNRKHLWVPPGVGGESAADMRTKRAVPFIAEARRVLEDGSSVIAIAHHTSIMALRSVIENRRLEEVVSETRQRKIPNAGGRHYVYANGDFTLASSFEPPKELRESNG